MKPEKNHHADEAVLIALEQIGKTLQLMESLFQHLEQHVHSRLSEEQEAEQIRLDFDIPSERTVH
ncbi:hypothetical protein A3709_03250 [Halioglobus sp. HI00S01]|uniref:hypothetical protein n=1 Tax=Halioglobus sp. HI00S01 TaxID=1822214 RepID=UPI0007C3BAC4|nr:hypothetical protein [Halioglobus sp. HI00S01]KZX56812.1 hypothetical protein A3709_03250 [Halioglobus sp. HI00S01]